MKEKYIEVLNKITHHIEQIDGGCKSCIMDFCDSLNKDIAKYGIMLEYSNEYPIKVKIIDIEYK